MLKTHLLVRHVTLRHVTHNLFDNTNNRTPSSTAYYHGGISFMVMKVLFRPNFFFDDCQRKFLDEMIRVALLVKILICCQNSTKSTNKYCESCHKYWGKMQKILKSVRAKTEYTEKDV